MWAYYAILSGYDSNIQALWSSVKYMGDTGYIYFMSLDIA